MKVPFVCCAFVLTGSLFAEQDTDALRKELEAFRTESTIRIQALENQLVVQQERATVDFDFQGYLRAGYGVDDNGNAQVAYQAPNADAKYRLGNEAETYLETIFLARTPPDVTGSADKKFDTQIRLGYSIPNSNNNENESTFSLREGYGTAAGLNPEDPRSGYWAGQRFYSRDQVHMNDFWYRDMTGYGGGIEQVNLGDRARFGIAWIGGSVDELDSDGTVFEDPAGQFRKDSVDVSLTEIASLGGQLSLMATYAYFNGDTVETEAGTVELLDGDGWAVNLYQDNELAEGVQNRIVLQYGVGVAYNFKGQLVLPTGLDRSLVGAQYDMEDIEQFRIIEDITIDHGGPVTGSGVLLYQKSDVGTATKESVEWVSAGIRPVYHFNQHYSIAAEAGWDYTEQSDGLDGSLFKVTLAPQVTPQMSVLSRPAIRLFVTYAWWSDDFQGLVGQPTHDGDTEGLSAGLQLETWW